MTAVYKDTLADIMLPEAEGGKYQWITQSTVEPKDGESYKLGYKPQDLDNYDWAAVEGWSAAYNCVVFSVPITVEKRKPEITKIPVELTADYGSNVSAIPLPYVKDGIWYWNDEEVENPTVSASGLPDGVLEWQTEDAVIDTLEEQTLYADFVPEDTEHYDIAVNIPVIVKVKHTHQYGDDWEKDADSHWHECECGDIQDKAAHAWDAGIVQKEATATEDGVKLYTCTVCDKTKEEVIPATGEQSHTHVYKDTWEKDADAHWHECECGEIQDKTVHTWDAGVVQKEATATEDGLKLYTCTVCAATKTEVIKATGSTSPSQEGTTEAPSQGGTTQNPPQTGEGDKTGKALPEEGTVLSDSTTKAKYKVTSSGEETPAVMYLSYTATAATLTIPARVTIDGIDYVVTAIADNAFKNNKKLKKITIAGSIITIGNSAFQGCTALTAVKLGGTVQSIGNKAFYGCKKLNSLTLGANVTTIGNSAFYNCTSLKKVIIPKKVKKIGSKAFYGCKKLVNITIKTTKLTTKNVGSKAFTKAGSSNYKKLTVKVPKSKLKTYKTMLKKKGLSSKARIKK